MPVGDGPQDVTWAPDGRFAYVANVDDDTVSVIDAATMTVTATVVDRGRADVGRGAAGRAGGVRDQPAATAR